MTGLLPSGLLVALEPGQPVVFGGDRIAIVPDDLARAFRPGDRLIIVQSTGALLHVPSHGPRAGRPGRERGAGRLRGAGHRA